MQTIFFLKTPKAEPTASNSITLRFKLAETGKPKVKGLGISCSKKDWNQDDQQVRRSHPQFKKHNDQLEFITKQLTEIEKERNVKAEDIDTIVKASIKGISVKELEDKGTLLVEMITNLYEIRKDSEAYSEDSKRSLISAKNALITFEEKVGYKVSANSLNKSALSIQNDFVAYFRSIGNKDSSIKLYLTVLNSAINYHSKFTGNEVKTFSKKDTKWTKREKQIVALNKTELEKLYNFVFSPIPDNNIKTTKAELRNIKFFLFRCFSGMRIIDMHNENINQQRLKATAKTFSFFLDKGTKSGTVSCIGSYLFDIAESLNWDFPNFQSKTALSSYAKEETKAVRKHLRYLLKDDMRKIQHLSEKGHRYTNLSEEITTHTARKTYSHLLYRLTNDIMRVKKELGHRDIETAMKYLDFNLDSDSMDLKSAIAF